MAEYVWTVEMAMNHKLGSVGFDERVTIERSFEVLREEPDKHAKKELLLGKPRFKDFILALK